MTDGSIANKECHAETKNREGEDCCEKVQGYDDDLSYTAADKFALIYNTYKDGLKYKAYTILRDNGWAEDAVQWTFLKLYNHINNVGNPYSDRTRWYVYTILVNNCYSIARKNSRYYQVQDKIIRIQEPLAERADFTEHLLYEEVMAELMKIPEIYSNLLILHAVYHYSFQEISVMLEIKPATVRKRVERARKMLEQVKTKFVE